MSELRVWAQAAPLCGRVAVAGDKSIGHRALMAGALCDGVVDISGFSGGEDNLRTMGALRALGVRVDEGPRGPGTLAVHGVGLEGLSRAAAALDCGNSGTSIRLLMGLLSSRPFESELFGDASLTARPMRRVAEPLLRMGARVEGAAGTKAGELYPPVRVAGPAQGRLSGIDFESKVASAQVKSAVLLAGLGADGVTRVREPGPSRDHTERMLAYLGVPLTHAGGVATLDPVGWNRRLIARPLAVPGDISAAAFLLVAGLIVPGSELVIEDVGVNPTRTGILDALAAMGAEIVRERPRDVAGEPVADLAVRAGTLKGVVLEGDLIVRAIDELPILAVCAAFAEGRTEIRDAAELRVKESDRIAATARELRRFGVTVEERPDGLIIEGAGPAARLSAAHVRCQSDHDHRIAMSAAIAALGRASSGAEPPVEIADADNIVTSFPSFVAVMRELGARIETCESPSQP